jgi:aspartyl-tRNA(Asn)/glutamyl-tRNA(Gln) amidotransferase subunit C
MAVTRADIQRIAELAELAVDDATAAELEGQLSRILDYVAQLQQLPQGGAGHGDERAVRLRRDEVHPDRLLDPPAAFAPTLKQGLFLVPRLAELAPGAADE